MLCCVLLLTYLLIYRLEVLTTWSKVFNSNLTGTLTVQLTVHNITAHYWQIAASHMSQTPNKSNDRALGVLHQDKNNAVSQVNQKYCLIRVLDNQHTHAHTHTSQSLNAAMFLTIMLDLE